MDMFSGTVKIVVPDGMVVGVSPDNFQSVAWTYKVLCSIEVTTNIDLIQKLCNKLLWCTGYGVW
ncbi:hypothetical protein DPMN_098625 [Dreissena polymorpha]|uniref:Uncharacterized protein n=1 Tax=Dreissena polymorpha TaxID=45954 RepID=A0A9D4LDE3_DREPO|nr:hypothetical protein DPMN_098625 [Dreissena polymorpha]